ncbi:MAG: transcriptional regulator [Microbacterium sp.]|nr:transcriptional regulator [Microbacterium sp.]
MSSQETPRRPTIADVAREAGVATSTASVVFSGKAKVAPATRERVLAAAAELGYAGPDPRAASLRRGRSGIVAVVLEGHLRAAFLDPVTTAMMDGLTDGLADLSAGILLMRDEPGEGTAIADAPVDAVVLIGCSGRTRA